MARTAKESYYLPHYRNESVLADRVDLSCSQWGSGKKEYKGVQKESRESRFVSPANGRIDRSMKDSTKKESKMEHNS